MWESVQEDALFLLWNILSSLIPKQELCLFLFFLSVVCWRRCSGGGWRPLGRRAEVGDAAAQTWQHRVQLILSYSRTLQTKHIANKPFWSALEGQTGARVISHLRAGDLSPVSLCRRDKEGLPPRFASQAHVLFLRRKEQSPTLKSQRAKIDTSAWMGSLFSRRREPTLRSPTPKKELTRTRRRPENSGVERPEQRRVCHRAETTSFVGVRLRLNCRFNQDELKRCRSVLFFLNLPLAPADWMQPTCEWTNRQPIGAIFMKLFSFVSRCSRHINAR